MLLALSFLFTSVTWTMEQPILNESKFSESDYQQLRNADIDIEAALGIDLLNKDLVEKEAINSELKEFLETQNILDNYKILKLEKKDNDIFALMVDPNKTECLFKFDGTTGHIVQTIDSEVLQFAVHPSEPLIFICKRREYNNNNNKMRWFDSIYVRDLLCPEKNIRIFQCPFRFFIDQETTYLSFGSNDLTKDNLYFYNSFPSNIPLAVMKNKQGAFQINLEHFLKTYNNLNQKIGQSPKKD